MLILHYTGMRTAQAALDRLRGPDARVSSHYVVDEDGTVWRLVAEQHRAWHAGVSQWRGHGGLNDRSVGIEVVNPGHEWGYRPFPALQMAALCDLCLGILGRHPIPARNVVGHSDVAPERKQDPGELFDWPGLAANGVGVWPENRAEAVLATGMPQPLGAVAALPYAGTIPPSGTGMQQALRSIGYGDAEPTATLRAFQRHWLPQHLTGQADEATQARLHDVAAALERSV